MAIIRPEEHETPQETWRPGPRTAYCAASSTSLINVEHADAGGPASRHLRLSGGKGWMWIDLA